MLKRLEIVPYKNLDEQRELSAKLAKQKKQRKFKDFHDLENCFLIEHFLPTKCNIRV